LVKTDVIDNEEDHVEDEELDVEYINEVDVVLEEIGDDSDEDEAIDAEEQSEIGEDDSEGDDNNDEDNDDYDYNDESDKDDDVDEDNNNGDSEEVQISDIPVYYQIWWNGISISTTLGRYLHF